MQNLLINNDYITDYMKYINESTVVDDTHAMRMEIYNKLTLYK